MKLFSVTAGGVEYWMDAAHVAGVGLALQPMPVPGSPPHLLGLQGHGGKVMPVIDLRILLGAAAVREGTETEGRSVLVRTEKASALVVVDSVKGIAESGPSPRLLDIGLVLFGEPSPPGARLALNDGLQQIRQGLCRHASFTISDLNSTWVRKRHARWAMSRYLSGKPASLEGAGDAAEFLKDFTSPSIGRLWDREMRDAFRALLRGKRTGAFTVLNRGCGRGMDAYSIACILASARPRLRAKIWADGDDLEAMAAAQSLTLERAEIPDYLLRSRSLSAARGGYAFSRRISEMIVFSFADILSPIEFPPADLIVARDVLSYVGEDEQRQVLDAFRSALRPGGILVIGARERPPTREWRAISRGKIPAYRLRD